MAYAALDLPADLLSTEARPQLLDLFRSLSLRHDELGMEIVLNALLRNFVHHKLYEAAESVVANCAVKQPYRSTNQAARFFYYDGLTKAMRLDYTGAHASLMQALRKGPQGALGFRVAATKLYLVVQLLNGEIPPRSEFLGQDMKKALEPYLQLTMCVRFGNLGRFQNIANKHQAAFEHDCTHSLILRVRQNVIKMGLRRICQAYSRIGISDVCVKLSLDNPEDAEYIVAKAIKDGVIDATIDHEKGHIVTSESVDVYSTTEPLHAFQRRIQFCNAAHDEARRSMRYATELDSDDAKLKAKLKREAMDRAIEEEDDGDADFSEGI
jgi:26S proteasome regulatory subunit N3